MYNYLVSYIFSSKGYLTPGYGTIQLSREKKIKTFEDINEITEFIKKSINTEDIVNLNIYNFILLGKTKTKNNKILGIF